MYVYRALNECDMVLKPKENGLFGKKIVFDNTMASFNFITSVENVAFKDSKEAKKCYTDVKSKMICGSNYTSIIEDAERNDMIYKKKYQQIFDFISGKSDLSAEERKEINDYFMKLFKSSKGHMRNGSNVDSNWISFAKDLNSLKRYYLSQNTNQIAVVDSKINGVIDQGILAVDVSNKEAIDRIKDAFVIKHGDKYYYTSDRFVGYNFAIDNKEVLYYNHIPSERIIHVLDQFQSDLAYNGILDEEKFYSYGDNKKKNYMFYIYSKNIYGKLINRGKLLDIYKDLYDKNISVNKLVEDGKYTKEELLDAKREIISCLEANSELCIKPFNRQKIKLMEE